MKYVMMIVGKIKDLLNIINKKCICKDCKYKVKISHTQYLCLMNNGIINDYGKCCNKYNK